jgi:large subunit ribosomal protein L19
MLNAIDFATGDIVKVHQKIQEGEKTRIQVFKGIVLGIRGRGQNKMFTVQKKVGSVLVERIWPVYSPMIEKVEISEKPRKRVRRSQLAHLGITHKN